MAQHISLKLVASIAVICTLTATITYLFVFEGITAKWIFLWLLLLSTGWWQINLLKRQNKQLENVIRALANGDSTLGLAANHPLHHHLDGVKLQLQDAQFNAEQQTQFLKNLLIHIELAVIICNDQGDIIETNPACAKLLNQRVTHLTQLNELGDRILSANYNQKSTIAWQVGEKHDTFALQISLTDIHGQQCKFVTLHSIHNELLDKEQQAYKRLTQVLTHEVANSITPLSSIAQTCEHLIPSSLAFDDEEQKQDLQLALKTINSRTQHLGDFIAQFRQVSHLPKPKCAPCDLKQIVNHVIALHQESLELANIKLTIAFDTEQLIQLDKVQIEQVIINLLKNAIDALKDIAAAQRHITITLSQNHAKQVYLDIADSGQGVEPHAQEMIFVPFYSTKQQGSGIGLSLSRHIMINHGGDLIYLDNQKGACFRCIFG